jgi:hypothetical protein
MIPVSLETLPLAYVAICAGIIALAWGISAIRARKVRRAELSDLIQCAACGTLYPDPKSGELPPCPCCQHRNERAPVRMF